MVDLEDACLFAAFVLPEHEGRGLGLGRRLVQAAEAALFARHAAAWLETDATSRPAQKPGAALGLVSTALAPLALLPAIHLIFTAQ